ncbi:MAG TPA: inositol monophosphatase [Spirochaeta sp.]|nr:inositol monophosphatase [Spirochaeta sp.]
MHEDTEQILLTAKKAAAAASEIIMGLQDKAKIDDKGINNLVTEADVKSEEAIRKIILDSFPEHSILGEEGGGDTDFDADNLWVIDPLDGTNNYAHGFPFFSVSIAYSERGKTKVGLVFDPVRNEIFHAISGKGAFLNEIPISVTDNKLTQALVITGFYYDRGDIMRSTLAMLQRLFENNIRGVRRTGSAALDFSYVAAGRADAYVEYMLSPWDFAAGMLILTEAGGDCRQADGKPLTLKSNTLAVSNGAFTDELLKLVRYPLES